MKDQDKKKLEAMLAQQDKETAELMKELKAMGGGEDDDDPDMKELHKEMMR